LQQSR